MSLTDPQRELLARLKVDPKVGLSRDEASKRRQDEETFNVVDPPVKCPAWICCLLPCIKSIPSMRAFREIVPEDAEVLRDTRWTRYDATALVKGDIIRFVEGDIVPADCILLSIPQESPEVLVDTRAVTGESKPRSIEASGDVCPPAKLFYGSRILQGSGVAVVIAIGPSTVLASLIRQKKFPAKAEILEPGMDDDISRIGISLVPLADGVV